MTTDALDGINHDTATNYNAEAAKLYAADDALARSALKMQSAAFTLMILIAPS